MPAVLIPLAEGCEELEAVTLIDILRRADINVTTASLTSKLSLTASRGVQLIADCFIEDISAEHYDMILLPGGMPGTTHLNDSAKIHQLLHAFNEANKAIAAICAAPLVLASAGLLNHKHATCYPNVLTSDNWPTIHLLNQAVVIDERILTSQGPGTAMEFALVIIEYLTDKATRTTVEAGLVRPK
jgi:4-methyl-5(b-hydroxyethyl)-thiazole monophosphate biosynthesis